MITWDRAYLINLDRQPDRLFISSVELDKWNIEFERFPAIDNRKALDKYYSSGGKIRNKALESCEGCRQSHINVMKQALKDNVTPLIIEDDIIIRKHFRDVNLYLDALERHSKGNWDVFYFYRDCRRQWLIEGEPLLRWGPTIACHFYMINKKSLPQIIEIASDRNHSHDWNLLYAARSNRIKCYCSSINLVCQDSQMISSTKGGLHTKRLGGILIKRRNNKINV